jgi:hypothetical protein
VTAAGACCAGKNKEGGGCAAAHCPDAPRRLRGRPSGVQGAAHRADARRPAAALDPGASAAPGGRKSGQARACPAGRAAQDPAPSDASENGLVFDKVSRTKITRMHYEEVSTLPGDCQAPVTPAIEDR